jgi:cell division protein FtsI/penicillin-binding protein 2
MRGLIARFGFISLMMATSNATGQQLAPSPSTTPSATPSEEVAPPALDEEIVPTFETQKLARTYILDIPAPRGQITDRNGAPFAQNRLSYSLAINFPTPLEFNDSQTLEFAHRQIAIAQRLLGRQIRIADDAILRHYHNRGILPFEISTNLSAEEYEAAKAHLPSEMTLRGAYIRVYPQGKVAGQIVGYCGRTGRNPDGIIDNHETIWPETEGREGIEHHLLFPVTPW